MSMLSNIFCDYCGAANAQQAGFCFACGRKLAVSLPVAAPVLLRQRYVVLQHLGAGGFGKVYKVEDRQLNNRLLAAKKLDLNAIPPKDQQDAINSFKQEAALLASLPPHPNLPRIYEYFAEQGDYFLVMDFIEGETLEGHLDNLKPALLPVPTVVNIGIQLATVLDFLHTRQPAIIFRDLKPENIMFTPDQRIYLIDFGIARHFKPGQAGDTVRWGTILYAAPEQLAGVQTSARSDIYSLGVVLHEMLSGNRPQPRRLAPLQLSGPGHAGLVHLIERLLKDDPQERPASAAEVKRELQHIFQQLQQPASIPTTPARPGASAQSSVPTQFAGTASPPASSISHKAQPRARGELYYIHRVQSTIHALAWSPDGLHIAAAGERPEHVYLWQALSGTMVQIYQGHTRSIWALAWAPGGQHLASAGNDRAVRVWNIHSPRAVYTYQEHRNWVQALAWSPTGGLIASGDENNQVHLWEGLTGKHFLAYQGHRSPVRALAFSPDGSSLASAEENGSVHIWETARGKLLATYGGHCREVSSLAWSPDSRQIVSASADRSVQIWEALNGTLISTYAGHQRMVNAIAWLPANKLIASAGQDKTVQIWEPQTGQTLFTYRDHMTGVQALAWSPDGVSLASVGSDAAVHVWRTG